MILPTALAQELASQRSATLARMAHYPAARSRAKVAFAERHPVSHAVLQRLSRADLARQAPTPPASTSPSTSPSTSGSPMGCVA